LTGDISLERTRREPGPLQVPLSALEHYEYCPRQAGLILVEEGYADDEATVRGTLLHGHVHEPGDDFRAGIRTLRALPVWHDDLGLTGICDVVEIYGDGAIIPVEHKSGYYRPGGPADVQLAGQAICLEQMFRTDIPTGAIFSASSRRRYEVQIDSALRERVAATTGAIRTILDHEGLPAAVADKRCERCSMNHICMPRVLAGRRAFTSAAASLFVPSQEASSLND